MTNNSDGLKYDFDVAPDSTYVRAAGLIAAAESTAHSTATSTGRVVDLGAGVGSLGTALAARGLGYVGFDLNAGSVAEMRHRGFDAHVSDLNAVGAVDELIGRVAPTPTDPVIAVVALDVIEHLPEPEHTVRTLTEIIDRIAMLQDGVEPILVLSVPNVAHVDLGAKLAAGRWDITDVGLLDRTHISLFTAARLGDVLGASFTEIGRDDVVLAATEQRDDIDHPVFTQGGLGAYLRHLRDRTDDWATTYQFVRAYRRASMSLGDGAAMAADTDTDTDTDIDTGVPGPFLSVIVRTMGDRRSLIDTLASLAAQTDRDLDVLLMVHHPDPGIVEAIRARVAAFGADFVASVSVHHVLGGGRSAPLNAALDAASGRYVAVLDDDDIVTTAWAEEFRRLADLHPGAVLRCNCVEQQIERRDTSLLDFAAVSGFDAPYPVDFDLFDSIRANRTPPCSFAVPLAAVRALDIRFDDTLRVCEDWKFQIDVIRYAGIATSSAITSVYRRWVGRGGSGELETREVWMRDENRVIDELDVVPTVLPPGALRRMRDLYRHIEHLERELDRRSDDASPLRFTE